MSAKSNRFSRRPSGFAYREVRGSNRMVHFLFRFFVFRARCIDNGRRPLRFISQFVQSSHGYCESIADTQRHILLFSRPGPRRSTYDSHRDLIRGRLTVHYGAPVAFGALHGCCVEFRGQNSLFAYLQQGVSAGRFPASHQLESSHYCRKALLYNGFSRIANVICGE